MAHHHRYRVRRRTDKPLSPLAKAMRRFMRRGKMKVDLFSNVNLESLRGWSWREREKETDHATDAFSYYLETSEQEAKRFKNLYYGTFKPPEPPVDDPLEKMSLAELRAWEKRVWERIRESRFRI